MWLHFLTRTTAATTTTKHQQHNNKSRSSYPFFLNPTVHENVRRTLKRNLLAHIFIWFFVSHSFILKAPPGTGRPWARSEQASVTAAAAAWLSWSQPRSQTGKVGWGGPTSASLGKKEGKTPQSNTFHPPTPTHTHAHARRERELCLGFPLSPSSSSSHHWKYSTFNCFFFSSSSSVHPVME